jgi:hypothetical protein
MTFPLSPPQEHRAPQQARPAFDRMRAQGAWTNRMEPAFPSLSLTNGVTISTGCWPEHHGIVSNLFLDPERGLYDHSSDAAWLEFVGPDFLDSSRSLKATHGYPVSTPGVEGVLYTRGSAFATGREVERVRAIDIHPTVMHILGLEPGRPVDGRVEQGLLREAE